MSSIIENSINFLKKFGYKINKFDKLRGPISISRITGMGKTIYLFGDLHMKGVSKCDKNSNEILFSDFLSMVLNKAEKDKKIIDIFIELPAFHTKKLYKYDTDNIDEFLEKMKEKTSPLFEGAYKYLDCIKKTKKCFHRFHNIDLRQLDLDLFNTIIESKYTDDKFNVFIFLLKDIHSNINDDKYINDLLVDTKIQKQLEYCDKEIGDKLFDIFSSELSDFQEMSKIIYSNILGSIKKEKDIFIANVNKYIYLLQTLAFYLVDFYTIARIMRKFKDNTNINNSIIIAGDEHIENYINFFKMLNFDTEIISSNRIDNSNSEEYGKYKELQCVSIKNLEFPLF